MAKIVLQDTNSGYNLSNINANFDTLADAINTKVLSRDNPTDDPNQMLGDMDMNGNRVFNLPVPISLSEAARMQDVVNAAFGNISIIPASIILNTPGHGISSTNVQTALYELADDTVAETTARTSADTVLQIAITAETTARATAITNEATTRGNADTALNTSVTALNTLTTTHTTQIAALSVPVVATTFNAVHVTALRGVSKASHNFVRTSGYYAAGDGGDSLYYCDLTDTTSADNGGSIIVAGDNGRWKFVDSAEMDFRQWGAKGDGSTDDFSTIQNALTSAPAGTKWKVSTGVFSLSATLSILKNNIQIEGTGQSTRFLCTHVTGDVFSIGNGSTQMLNTVFKDFAIDSSVAKTSGWAINGNQVARIHIDNVFASPPEFVASTPNMFNGFNFNRFDYATVDRCQIIVSGTGINANGNNDQSFGAGLYISGGTKISCNNVTGSIGVRLSGAAGGVVFGDCDIINCENNVQIDTSVAGINNREVFFESGCTLDGAGFAGCNVLANSVVQLMFTGTWLASSGTVNAAGPGLLIAAPQSAGMVTQLTGTRVFNNKGGGVICNAGGFTISGGLIRVNGTSGSGGHGVSFPTANINSIQVTGATIIDNGVAAQGFGIAMAAGCTSVNIQTNTLRNNAQGTKSIGSSGTFVIVANNVEG